MDRKVTTAGIEATGADRHGLREGMDKDHPQFKIADSVHHNGIV
jgi:hypothetical protein